jgi:molecular chaperone DnaJ
MPIFKNYYQILGVDAFAEPDAVKAAFRKLARRYHPDLNAGNAQAEEKFKEINEAYEVLSNAEKRALHDMTLKAMNGLGAAKVNTKKYTEAAASKGKANTPAPESKKPKEAPPPAESKKQSPGNEEGKQNKSTSTPINELFETFLKKGFSDQNAKADGDEGIFRKKKEADKNPPPSQEKPKRGEDVVVKTAITPQEATDGVVKTVNVQHNEICRRCSGTGKVNGSACSACNGDKILVRHKKIDVRIPSGVKNGSRVRVAPIMATCFCRLKSFTIHRCGLRAWMSTAKWPYPSLMPFWGASWKYPHSMGW